MAQNNDVLIPKTAIDGITKANTEIVKLDESTYKFISTVEKLSKELKDNNITLAQVQKAQKKTNENSKTAAQLAEQESKAKEKQRQATEKAGKAVLKNIRTNSLYAKSLEKQAKETEKLTAKEKELVDALKLEVKTEKDAIRQNKALRAVRQELDSTTEEGIKKVKELNEVIDKNSEILKGNADAATAAKINVGNYKEDIEAALSASDKFSGGTTNVINNFVELSQQEGGVTAFFSSFIGGVKGATKAAIKFIATPIGAIIAAVVVGIATFSAALSRNQELADSFGKVWSGIKNVLSELLDRWISFATAFVKFYSFDFKGATEELGNAFGDFSESMNDAYNSGVKLFELQKKLERSTISYSATLDGLNRVAAENRVIEGDATKSFKEREEAANKARVAESQAAALRITLSKQAKDIVDEEVKLAISQGTITRDLRKKQAEAASALSQAESDYTVTVKENEKIRSELKQDRLERDLDILIDGFDNQKTINERLLESDNTTYEQKKKILEDTKKLSNDSFNKQIETIEKFTDASINANDLIATSDAVVLNEKIRALGLSEIIEGRLLEVIRERRIAVLDLSDAENSVLETARTAAEQYKTTWATAVKELSDEIKSQVDEESKYLMDIFDAELDAEIARSEEEIDAWAKKEAEKTKATEDEAAKREAINEKAKELVIAAANGAFDIYQNGLDRQSQANQIQKENELRLANGNKREEERINAKFEAKEIELKKKKDRSEKTQALFNIALSTAQAIASVSPVVPLMILAGALGAIQLAVAASQPLPQYWTGIDSVPTDSAVMVGERGRELIEKNGKFSIANKPTITSGLKGAKVYNNKETEMLLNGRSGGSTSIDISELSAKQDETNDILRRMGKLPIHKRGTHDIFKDQIKYPV